MISYEVEVYLPIKCKSVDPKDDKIVWTIPGTDMEFKDYLIDPDANELFYLLYFDAEDDKDLELKLMNEPKEIVSPNGAIIGEIYVADYNYDVVCV